MKIHLVSQDDEMIKCWKQYFHTDQNLLVTNNDIFSEIEFRRASSARKCLVSPANSFGFMDGGLDKQIRNHFNNNGHPDIQSTVRDAIKTSYQYELLVGQAMMISTGVQPANFLLIAPTMRVQSDIRNTVNVYLATRAIFLTLKQYAAIITEVFIPALGTGIGKMSPETCAFQMKCAWEEYWSGWPPSPIKDIHQAGLLHDVLKKDR